MKSKKTKIKVGGKELSENDSPLYLPYKMALESIAEDRKKLTSFFICEEYPMPINNERFGSEWSALEYAKRHYGLPDDYLFGSNGMGYLFHKDGEWKGFRILVE